MRGIRLVVIVFGFVLGMLAGTLVAMRDSEFDDEWATLMRRVDYGAGLQPELSLFHPPTSYHRTLMTADINHYFESMHWSPDGVWLLGATRDQYGGSAQALRLRWSGIAQAIANESIDIIELLEPGWSPNEEWAIVFVEQDDTWDMMLLGADGVVVATLFEEVPHRMKRPILSWTPNSQMVYVAIQLDAATSETTIYTIDVNRRQKAPVLLEALPIDLLAASSDGAWLAVIAEVPPVGSGIRGLFRMRTDTAEVEFLRYVPSTLIREMWWTADGNIMIMMRNRNYQFELHGVDPTIAPPDFRMVADVQELYPEVAWLDDIDGALETVWTQDRQKFATLLKDNQTTAVVIMNADGSGEWRYPIDADCAWYQPNWILRDEWLRISTKGESGNCHGVAIRPYEDEAYEIADLLPDGQLILPMSPYHDTWQPVWYDNGQQLALRNLNTGELIDLPDGAQVLGWSKVPTQDEDGRRAFVMGLVILGMSVLSFGSERFSRWFSSPTTAV